MQCHCNDSSARWLTWSRPAGTKPLFAAPSTGRTPTVSGTCRGCNRCWRCKFHDVAPARNRTGPCHRVLEWTTAADRQQRKALKTRAETRREPVPSSRLPPVVPLGQPFCWRRHGRKRTAGRRICSFVYSGKPGAEVISFSERVIVAQRKMNVKKIQKLPGVYPLPLE